MATLAVRAYRGLAVTLVLMALAVFVAAGTTDYWQAWVFLAVYGAVTAGLTAQALKRDPALVRRRMKGGMRAETAPRQKIIMACASVFFVALLVVPAAVRRAGGPMLPAWAALAGDALVVAGVAGVGAVFRANSHAAATIQVEAGQRVVDTGPYARVRHPMYAAALVMLAGFPLALGSAWGLLPLIPLAAVVNWRLVEEERFLAGGLPGYAAYAARVRWRLLPGVY
ncbi:methyltransferase family protein [Acidisphaera rubrifaciens]|uniref:S-isoprenylcysteine methyltransferase n=1 Tax=Acidisphaera rubrifaciens HS-AP3 TaxID=1231350 RepID=A0A0D6PBA5_9PROT|nr:isoprenylcysteine carboxylmethyltransferase family protein [Acidisphaera rubrifaciens]GAN78134.1 S-isoprenylcysteine methyltransferase [Acidisphaera rubrifaciens HS-AP3]